MKKLIDLLKNHQNIDEYKIIATKTSSTELFFIKDELQMNRGKDVEQTSVVVYRNFEENGKKFKGSASTVLSPTMSLKEIEGLLDTAGLAASFVKNEYYELEVPNKEKAPTIPSKFSEGEVIENISKLVEDLYKENHQFDSFINSTEFFINKREARIINSNGIDVSFTRYFGEIELITEAKGEKESIESYEVIEFSDYNQEDIKNAIVEALKLANLRSKAIPMPKVNNVPVILDGAAAKNLWEYYVFNASASAIYNKLHNNKVGDSVQDDAKYDKVSINMVPVLENSSRSNYYDGFGTLLKDVAVIKDGTISNMIANKRFSYYLDLPCTGELGNYVITPGSYSEKELKSGSYLEILKFSAFQSDPLTGNFGGEFRLGIFFDGEKEIPVTLGSISANIKQAHKEMYLSKELVKDNNFYGPQFIKFNNVTIAGN